MSLPDNIIQQRRGSVTGSAVHCIMTGWEKKRPDCRQDIYNIIDASDGKKLLVGDAKSLLDDDSVTGKDIAAAMEAWKFDQPNPGLITYAEKLACEELYSTEEIRGYSGEGNKAIENGNAREPECMRLLSEASGYVFSKTGDDQIHINRDGMGITPDGVALNEMELIEAGGEAKCRGPLEHTRQLFIVDNQSLLKLDFDRYCQIQLGIVLCELDEWHTGNYNPEAEYEWMRFHHVVIKRDHAFIAVMMDRIATVKKHKAIFMRRIMKLEKARAGEDK